jgi:hypothetical protein
LIGGTAEPSTYAEKGAFNGLSWGNTDWCDELAGPACHDAYTPGTDGGGHGGPIRVRPPMPPPPPRWVINLRKVIARPAPGSTVTETRPATYVTDPSADHVIDPGPGITADATKVTQEPQQISNVLPPLPGFDYLPQPSTDRPAPPRPDGYAPTNPLANQAGQLITALLINPAKAGSSPMYHAVDSQIMDLAAGGPSYRRVMPPDRPDNPIPYAIHIYADTASRRTNPSRGMERECSC